MAYAHIASVAVASPGGTPATTSAIDTTGANLIVISVGDGGTSTPTDSKGNTWTGLTVRNVGGDLRGRLYYSYAPTVGTGHTFTVPNSYGAIAVAAFSGAVASPFDVENGAADTDGGGTTQPGSVTPSENSEIVITGLGLGGSANTLSINGGFTIAASVDGIHGTQYGAAIAYLIQTTAAAANPTWSYSGGSTAICATIASFKDTPAASAVSLPPILSLLQRVPALRMR